jgi:hypothetical protein
MAGCFNARGFTSNFESLSFGVVVVDARGVSGVFAVVVGRKEASQQRKIGR